MPYDDVLVHTAVPIRKEEIGSWVEGEPDVEETFGTSFACCLFLPGTTEENAPRGRRAVRRPTLLCAAEDDAGEALDLSHSDELDVTAAELTGADPIRWQVEAIPQPFGRPGDDLIGKQVTLRRVED